MSRRPSVILLAACLAVLTACQKKPADGGGNAPDPAPGSNPAPPAVSADYPLFVHFDVKSVRDSAAHTELRTALAKHSVEKVFDELVREESRDLGFNPTKLDAITFCVTEVSPREEPKIVAIFRSSEPFDKTATFRVGERPITSFSTPEEIRDARDKKSVKPDDRGFFKAAQLGRDKLLHFPDDKTAVLLSASLAQKYLDGYAKDRTAWPLSADLLKQTAGHTLYVTASAKHLPIKELPEEARKDFGSLLDFQTAALTVDIKGKELIVAGRAAFPDAATAGKAKEPVQKIVGFVLAGIEESMDRSPFDARDMLALDAFKPVLTEARRALKETKVEVSGSDLTLAGSYRADFDIAKVVSDAVKETPEAARRLRARNNLLQCGLAMHNYNDTNGVLPIHGTGPKGAAIKNATDKPLLSWRVAILPFIEEDALYRQFKLDEPWDSENNKKLIEKMPKLFGSITKPGKPGYTHLQMVVGPTAMQPGAVLQNIKDGTSQTIALVEAAEPVIWTKPDDVMVTGKEAPKELRKRFGGQFAGGFFVALWDGSVRFIPDTFGDQTIVLALNPNDGQPMPDEWETRRRPKVKK